MLRPLVMARFRAILHAPRAAVLLGSLTASFAIAPFQCAREPDPDKAVVEEPDEALYHLAERFQERGDNEARVVTLRYLVERYPSSRFAARARQELGEAQDTVLPKTSASP